MRMDHQLYSSKYNLLKFIEIKDKNYLNMTMKKIYFIFVFSLISLLSSCSKTSEEEINLEGLNIVAPGIVRTPEERFMDLRDYPFQPNYMMIDGIRIHYLDEGPREADPIILMHGLPTWSYLYRKMIPIFVKAGHRVIVPDMVGFGKSDKYIEKKDYSYLNHKELMKKLFINLDLDNITLGLQEGDLILVAGRPSMGKTAFALSMAANFIQNGLPVLFFSMEMSNRSIMYRVLSIISKVDLKKLQQVKDLTADDHRKIEEAASILHKSRLFVDDTSGLTPSEILSRARRLKREHQDLALIAIDYLQLMSSDTGNDNRVTEMGDISRSVKAIAKDCLLYTSPSPRD